MYRYKLTIEYDGSNFSGWQKQEGEPSVQETIAKALQKFCGQELEVCGALSPKERFHNPPPL